MSIFGSGLQGLANGILSMASRQLTLTQRIQSGAYSPTNGMAITATASTITGAIVPYETFARMGMRKNAGLTVIEGDMVAMVSAISQAGGAIALPRPDDLISDGATVYSVVSVARHAPAGVDLMFLCSLRGSK